MPKYTYKCQKCEYIFDTFHSIKTTLENCEKCVTQEVFGSLERIPSSILGITNKSRDGQVVDEFIKTTKDEIQQYKKELRGKEIENND